MNKKEEPLKNTTIGLMISTAIFFDVLQWLLGFIFLDWLVGFFAFMTFWLWFKLHGITYMKPKRLGVMSVATIIEFIPFVSLIPAWTLSVTILTLDTKIKSAINTNPEDTKKASSLVNKLKNSQGKISPYELND